MILNQPDKGIDGYSRNFTEALWENESLKKSGKRHNHEKGQQAEDQSMTIREELGDDGPNWYRVQYDCFIRPWSSFLRGRRAGTSVFLRLSPRKLSFELTNASQWSVITHLNRYRRSWTTVERRQEPIDLVRQSPAAAGTWRRKQLSQTDVLPPRPDHVIPSVSIGPRSPHLMQYVWTLKWHPFCYRATLC